jgi:hypothetical protein
MKANTVRQNIAIVTVVVIMSAFAVQRVVSNQPNVHAVENKSSVPSSQQDRIIVQNYYYAQPNKSEDLYQRLLEASNVREKLGFARGRLLRRIAMSGVAFGTPPGDKSGPEDLPDVVWECEFPDIATREHEFQAVIANPDYEAVHKRMLPLMRRMARATYKVSESTPNEH